MPAGVRSGGARPCPRWWRRGGHKGRHCAIAIALAASAARGAEPTTPPVPRETTVTVFAAASLTAAFKEIGAAFERAYPGTTVQLNFAGSSTLVQQIQEGAPAAVFASADQPNMQILVQAGRVDGTPRIFARNRLAIVVPKGNPRHVATLADLTAPGLTLALCAPSVPAGRYAAEAFAKAGLPVPAASQEADVKAVVSKAMLGEIDAGIVYVTDVAAAGATVEGIAIPDQYNVVAQYPIAVLRGAAHPRAAAAFVEFVLATPAQTILRRFGFLI
jgi:molybdate transport system substrate-binding protein